MCTHVARPGKLPATLLFFHSLVGLTRPVSRLPQSDAGGASELVCAHCGTSDTPRWWKDNFPMGTLCNACGIWLKRHGGCGLLALHKVDRLSLVAGYKLWLMAS